MADPRTFPARTFTVPGSPDPSAIPLPFDPREAFGSARAPVTVEVGGHRYRSSVMTMKGATFVPFRAEHRAAAGVVAGDAFVVTLTLDTALRSVEAPADLAAAIADAGLGDAWGRLSYTRQREHVEAVESAKKLDTRTRRIAACLAMLAR